MASDGDVDQPARDGGQRPTLVLGVPLRSGTPHVVQFRPVGIEHVLFQRAPQGCNGDAHQGGLVAWVRHRTRPSPEWSLHDFSRSVTVQVQWCILTRTALNSIAVSRRRRPDSGTNSQR
jgi:hypothetical protein